MVCGSEAAFTDTLTIDLRRRGLIAGEFVISNSPAYILHQAQGAHQMWNGSWL